MIFYEQGKEEFDKEVSNREFKASIFTAYFGMPEHAADLYRALEHAEDIKPEDIEFTTLKGVMFMARKNDMAFTVKRKVLVVGEHQSTINRNMPLRGAIYYGRVMELLMPPRAMYKTNMLSIPTPEFYVFYNGTKKQPAEQILKLSDAYLEKDISPMLELIVKVININPSVNHPLLRDSRSLYEYSYFVQKVREELDSGKVRDEAITAAMEECITEDIMVDFIKEHGSEVRNMLFTEFNMEDFLEVRGEEMYQDGREAGKKEGKEEGERRKLIELLCKKLRKGQTLEMIADALEEEPEVIERLCKAAVEFAPDYDCDLIYEKVNMVERS